MKVIYFFFEKWKIYKYGSHKIFDKKEVSVSHLCT